jgi:hypothetical protein
MDVVTLKSVKGDWCPSMGAATMGLVGTHRYDVFLSYARDDNVLNDDVVGLFRTHLKRKLEAEIRTRTRGDGQNEATIFMDRVGLPANGDLSDELMRAVEDSLFLVIFVGRRYPDSQWCGTELAAFSRQFGDDTESALQRTFIVVLEKEALARNWGDHLDSPHRPIYEEFFDEPTGRLLPALLEDRDGRAVLSPRFSGRLRRIVETMADRAGDLRPTGTTAAAVEERNPGTS